MTKFADVDKEYLSERKKFAEKYGRTGMWDVVDPWPLYCGISNLSIRLAIADLLRSTLHVPGHIAEFGSWRGANLLFMAKILKIFDPYGSKMTHCFESFQGLTEFATPDADSVNNSRGLYKGSYEELLDVISLYKMNDEVVIHKGLIEETLPKVLQENKALSFSFVYCDTDLYNSTKLILESLHDRLSKGGLFVLDEWNHERFHGEGVAVNEFLKQHGHKYKMRHVHGTRQPNLVLEKIES